jgi:7-cyano-7-deazaguanine synthase in queuosine biosynthesis
MNRIIDHGVWIEADAPLADTPQWSIPLRLVKAVAEGEAANFGSISPLLAGNLETIRDIYAAWINGHKAPLNFEVSSDVASTASGVSLFFSGGVDSFYSLIKHRDEIDNLVLVHGFDIPLENSEAFALAETQVREAARLFGKRLIVVRTNLRKDQPNIPGGWEMYHGVALMAVAYALAPNHGKVYIASSYSYANLHSWGSNPLTDPLWSTEAVQIIHDGGETRMNKLRTLVQYPEVIERLRVCWENPGCFNCGLCEKCVRTMLALRALGVERCAAFPDILTPDLVRRQEVSPHCVHLWPELLCPGLGPALIASVQSAIHSCDAGLPPRTGTLKREVKRWLYAVRNAGRAFVSPIDRS